MDGSCHTHQVAVSHRRMRHFKSTKETCDANKRHVGHGMRASRHQGGLIEQGRKKGTASKWAHAGGEREYLEIPVPVETSKSLRLVL